MNNKRVFVENWNKSLTEEKKNYLIDLYNEAMLEDGQTQIAVKYSEWDEMFTKDVLDFHIFVLKSEEKSTEGKACDDKACGGEDDGSVKSGFDVQQDVVQDDLSNVKGFSLLVKYRGKERGTVSDFWLMQMLAVTTKSHGQGFGKMLLNETLNCVYEVENKAKSDVKSKQKDGSDVLAGAVKGLMLRVGDVFGGSLMLHAHVKKSAHKTQKFYKSNGAKLISQSVLIDEYGEQVHPLNWNVNRWKWQQEKKRQSTGRSEISSIDGKYREDKCDEVRYGEDKQFAMQKKSKLG